MTRRRPVVVLLHAAAEIVWLHACTAFASAAAIGASLPFGAALTAFAGGAMAAHFSLGRGFRKGSVLFIETIGIASVAAVVAYTIYYPSHPLLSTEWLRLFFLSPRTPVQWTQMLFMLFSFLLFWLGGTLLARRHIDYAALCWRFDVGLGAFFGLFLIELAILFKGGSIPGGRLSLYPMFAFLFFGIVAIVISRFKRPGSRTFLEGYGLLGITGVFLSVLLLVVSVIFAFLLPLLDKAAGTGYGAMRTAARLTAPFLVSVLRFCFGPRKSLPDPPSSSPKDSGLGHVLASGTWWADYLQPLMELVMKALAIGMLLFSAAVFLYAVITWLTGRTGISDDKAPLSWNPLSWFFRLKTVLGALLARIRRYLKGHRQIGEVYGGLLSWGRRSGMPAAASDTPAEFGSRLVHHFPALAAQIDLIVNAFNREVYGGIVLSGMEIEGARKGLRTLGGIRHWPARLKRRLVFRSSR